METEVSRQAAHNKKMEGFQNPVIGISKLPNAFNSYPSNL